jgi:hypothetical protein
VPISEDRCGWCKQPGHAEVDHPLPKDHPQYDAFNDASDDELAGMVNSAVWPNGQPLFKQEPGATRPKSVGDEFGDWVDNLDFDRRPAPCCEHHTNRPNGRPCDGACCHDCPGVTAPSLSDGVS